MYLYMKTIERAHLPNKLWQRIRLSKNYAKALAQLDEHLEHWPAYLVHKNKQRLTKITQYLIRMRRFALRNREKTVTVPTRKKRVDKIREAKAESAAHLEKTIEEELLSRLQQGTYGDIYNFPMQQYQKVLDGEEVDDPERLALEAFEERDEEEESEDGEEEDVDPYVEGESESESESEEGEMEEVEWDEEEEEEEIEDMGGRGGSRMARGSGSGSGSGSGKRKGGVELEYEMEMEEEPRRVLRSRR